MTADNNYKIVYSGALKPGTDPEKFVSSFIQLFKTPEEQARKLLTLGHAVTIKDNLPQLQAEKLYEMLDMMGMQVVMEPIKAATAAVEMPATPTVTPTTAQTETPDGGARCPKCGSTRIDGDDCLACGIIISRYLERQARLAADAATGNDNPYAAPQSDVTLLQPSDPGVMNGPHKVPAGNGAQWISDGWGFFRRNPFAWIGALIVWVIVMMVASLLPFLGSLLVNLFAPVFSAGFLLGTDAQRKGENFEVGHLFAGFSNNTGSLVLVGVAYMVGALIIIAISALMIGGTLMAMSTSMQSGGGAPFEGVTFSAGLILGLLVVGALWVPLVMAYWFAPALVALEGMGPIAAMKLSFSACLKNVLPFLVYSLLLLVLFILAIIPLGLGLLVVIPVMIAALYASYRDIFYASGDVQA